MKTPAHSLQAAIDAGLLPPGATLPEQDHRPWPVVLLTALGAWFAAVPLLLMVGMLLGEVITRGVGPYFVGVLVLAGAVVVMRAKDLPLFVEQLAVPALLVGGGCLAMGAYRDMNHSLASAALLGVVLLLARAIDKTWLRVLLGALGAGLLCAALLPHDWDGYRGHIAAPWLVLHTALGVWLLAWWAQQRWLLAGPLARVAALVEALAAGWLLTLLFGLAWLAGMSFLVGGAMGGAAGALAREVGAHPSWGLHSVLLQGGSAALALAGMGVAMRAWPGLRTPAPLVLALVMAGLCFFLPTLGAVLLAGAVCCSSHRWRLAGASAVAAAWVLGSFYYQLQWPLATKALVLVGAGCVLGALAWLLPRERGGGVIAGINRPGRAGWVMLAGGLLSVLVANGAIWQKQDLIARGQPVFIALAPVDPRSLMQGDYMALNFSVPDMDKEPLLQEVGSARPRVVAQRDARGVATVRRVHVAGQPLAVDELLIELTPKDGRWALVTDAWFFKEGEGPRWQAARFGEFRVLPDGRALLVGMADENLKPIMP